MPAKGPQQQCVQRNTRVSNFPIFGQPPGPCATARARPMTTPDAIGLHISIVIPHKQTKTPVRVPLARFNPRLLTSGWRRVDSSGG